MSAKTELEFAAARAVKPVRKLNDLLRQPVKNPRELAKTARAAHARVSVLWSLAELVARGARRIP